ncbi:MAG: transposase zinc-binding domain-containing protein [Bacteroidota bacterium]
MPSAQDNIGALFRDHGEAYIRTFQADRQTIKLIRSIRVCRTPALGGHQITCKGCGAVRYQYFSCGNAQCPICQGIKRLQWQDKLAKKMLKVPYCHITFTLPHQLNGLARKNPKVIYGMLMRVAWKTIDHLTQQDTYLGGKVGMTAVLHT